MAWAALIPIAAQVLGSMGKSDQAPGPALPPAPSLGDIFKSNEQKYQTPAPQFQAQSNPFSPIPTGGGARGPNG
jgi:hypothetical protein